MVSVYLLFAVCILIIFSFIWGGDCRLECRQSYFSVGGPNGASACGLVVQRPTPARTSYGCICESCPCGLIENFLKALSPATRMVNNFTKTFTHTLDQLFRILECRTNCRRHAQIVSPKTHHDSNDDFILVERQPKPEYSTRFEVEEPKVAAAKSLPEIAKQYGYDVVNKLSQIAGSISGTKTESPDIRSLPSSSGTKFAASHSSASKYTNTPASGHSAGKFFMSTQTISQDTLQPIPSIVDPTRNCSRCVQQGKTCIGGCPNAELKRRANKK